MFKRMIAQRNNLRKEVQLKKQQLSKQANDIKQETKITLSSPRVILTVFFLSFLSVHMHMSKHKNFLKKLLMLLI